MAQNITIAGASYSDVPAIQVPKVGSGTATFTDVSDTTATAADVSAGTYFYTAQGVRTEGTGSGGGAVYLATISIPLSWTNSGSGYYTASATLSGYTATADSKIDLQPDTTLILSLMADGVAGMYILNNNRTLTAYAIGAAPTAAISGLQCTVTEVQ